MEPFHEYFVRPDQPSKCTWHKGVKFEDSPHIHKPLKPRSKLLPNILHAIGHTPLVKLSKIPQSYGIKCDMYAKCEFLNPGGSLKDRIGFRMIEDCEAKGLIKPGYTLIEPTSGNTGIGIAMACAVKGYRCIIVMPEKMSNEKVVVLKALGAEIIRTPTHAAFDDPEGLIAVSQRLQKKIPNSYIVDQYRNPGNPLAHYDGTSAEILEDLDGHVDMIVAGTGTGGTISGIGRRIVEKCPNCIVVGADPEGSKLAYPESLNETDVTFYEVEGIGYDFIPTVLDRSVVHKWVKTNDAESLPLARRLIKDEGLLCGASSGSIMSAALKAAKDLQEGQKCVVILPDNIRNYLTKFVNDSWMAARNFIDDQNDSIWWWNLKASVLNLPKPEIILQNITCQEAVQIMESNGLNQLPVVDDQKNIKGVTTQLNIMTKLVNANLKLTDLVSKALIHQNVKVSLDTSLGRISRILEKETYVLLVNNANELNNEELIGIITTIDILKYISKKKE